MRFLFYTYYRINDFYYSFFEDFAFIDNNVITIISPGAVLIWILQFLILTSSILWGEMLLSIKDKGGYIFVFCLVGLVVLDYFLFIYKNRLKKYHKEYFGYSKRKRVIWDLLIIILTPAIIAMTIYSFIEFDKYKTGIH